MPTAFLDTSALVKRYHLEAGSDAIDRLFARPEEQLVVSRLGSLELQSALAAKVRFGSLPPEGRDAAMRRYLGDVKSRRLLVVRILTAHFQSAEQLISRHASNRRLRSLDALQIAVAKEVLGADASNRIISADADLLSVAVSEGLSAFNPLEVTS